MNAFASESRRLVLEKHIRCPSDVVVDYEAWTIQATLKAGNEAWSRRTWRLWRVRRAVKGNSASRRHHSLLPHCNVWSSAVLFEVHIGLLCIVISRRAFKISILLRKCRARKAWIEKPYQPGTRLRWVVVVDLQGFLSAYTHLVKNKSNWSNRHTPIRITPKKRSTSHIHMQIQCCFPPSEKRNGFKDNVPLHAHHRLSRLVAGSAYLRRTLQPQVKVCIL